MRLFYKSPWVDNITSRWEAFEEQARKFTPYLQRFGFQIDAIKYFKIPEKDCWKFSAFFKNSSRIIHLSLITNLYQEGAVSLFIYPISDVDKPKGINLYKYLRKHFKMVSRGSLFLNRYQGDFSHRLQKVFTSYAKLSQFYMQSILHGTKWED